MVRLGLNGATTGEADLLTDIRVAASAGYQGVELRDTKVERYLAGGGTLPALRDRLRDTRLEVWSLNALEDATLPSAEARQRVTDRMARLCEWAAALACPLVVVVPSPLPPGRWAPAAVRAQTAAALRALATVGERYGVRVGFEFLGFPACSVNTLAAARAVLDELDDPRVGLVIDAFHVYVGGSRLEDLDGLGERIALVHLDDAEPGAPASLTDAQRLLPGQGVIPLRPLLDRLAAVGYDGPYSLELFRPEYWAWDPELLAHRGLTAMRGLFDRQDGAAA